MAKRFKIEFSSGSRQDHEGLRPFDRRKVLDAIERKLTFDPNVETRDKKCLGQEPANFAYEPPLWELKAGEFRAFYEVNDEESVVYIHAIRRKPASKTTAEVLNEADGN